jgi:hypothetical protein
MLHTRPGCLLPSVGAACFELSSRCEWPAASYEKTLVSSALLQTSQRPHTPPIRMHFPRFCVVRIRSAPFQGSRPPHRPRLVLSAAFSIASRVVYVGGISASHCRPSQMPPRPLGSPRRGCWSRASLAHHCSPTIHALVSSRRYHMNCSQDGSSPPHPTHIGPNGGRAGQLAQWSASSDKSFACLPDRILRV